jgi:hypothetical protein
MKRIRPQIGQEVEAGTITAVLSHSGLNRSTRVEFVCRHCQDLNTERNPQGSRWAEVRSGLVKSCGCRSEQSFRDFHTRKAAEVETRRANVIAEAMEEHGSQAAAAMHGESSYLVVFLWKRWVERLQRRPDAKAIGQAVYRGLSADYVASKHSVSIWIVKRLAILYRRAAQAAAKAAEEAAKALKAAESLGSRLWEKAMEKASDALARVQNRYQRVLNAHELSVADGAKSEFGWAYEFMCNNPVPRMSLRATVESFKHLCQRTFEHRAAMRRQFAIAA